MDGERFQCLDIFIVDLWSDHLIQSGFLSRFPAHCLHAGIICHRIDLSDNLLILRVCDLGAVLPVYFVSVILRRIMAGSHHDSGCASQLPERKGEHRSRTKRREDIGLDPVGRKAERRFFGKLRRHISRVKRDSHSLFLRLFFQDEIGKTLGRLSHRIDIHPVGSCSDDSTESSCPEFQVTIESLLYLFFIVCYAF